MSYQTFIFESYEYDEATSTASFSYSLDSERRFTERIEFSDVQSYDKALLDKVLQLAFVVTGISYYKAFPTKSVKIVPFELSENQAKIFSEVYRDGLSQFVYENKLDPSVIAKFEGTSDSQPIEYSAEGISVLQSGGKDSLLLAELLKSKNTDFTAVHIRNSDTTPNVIEDIEAPVRTMRRRVDTEALKQAAVDGGLNGHVPVTYIVEAFALLDAVLHNENTVLVAIGREGEEPHDYIGDYAVRHQWAKTWHAEQLLADYVATNISTDIKIGSPLRQFSELKIAELFVGHAWQKYGRAFSSCNVANYMQGQSNERLSWCGNCPKCANSFLLFAPFVPKDDLISLFNKDLFADSNLIETFKGLLGIDGVITPFECVGETDELRLAYQLALKNGYSNLPFDVPQSSYDKDAAGPSQAWASQMLQ